MWTCDSIITMESQSADDSFMRWFAIQTTAGIIRNDLHCTAPNSNEMLTFAQIAAAIDKGWQGRLPYPRSQQLNVLADALGQPRPFPASGIEGAGDIETDVNTIVSLQSSPPNPANPGIEYNIGDRQNPNFVGRPQYDEAIAQSRREAGIVQSYSERQLRPSLRSQAMSSPFNPGGLDIPSSPAISPVSTTTEYSIAQPGSLGLDDFLGPEAWAMRPTSESLVNLLTHMGGSIPGSLQELGTLQNPGQNGGAIWAYKQGGVLGLGGNIWKVAYNNQPDRPAQGSVVARFGSAAIQQALQAIGRGGGGGNGNGAGTGTSVGSCTPMSMEMLCGGTAPMMTQRRTCGRGKRLAIDGNCYPKALFTGKYRGLLMNPTRKATISYSDNKTVSKALAIANRAATYHKKLQALAKANAALKRAKAK